MRRGHGRRSRLTSRIGALVCALAACASDAFALNPTLDVNQYAHAAWRSRDGFVNGAIITALAQTPDGYLWIGTEDGLFRFDGVRAAPWAAPAGMSLPSQKVASLLAGSDGTLWIGTERGLVSWRDSTILHYTELNGRAISRMAEDRQGSIWTTTHVSRPRAGVSAKSHNGAFSATATRAVLAQTRSVSMQTVEVISGWERSTVCGPTAPGDPQR